MFHMATFAAGWVWRFVTSLVACMSFCWLQAGWLSGIAVRVLPIGLEHKLCTSWQGLYFITVLTSVPVLTTPWWVSVSVSCVAQYGFRLSLYIICCLFLFLSPHRLHRSEASDFDVPPLSGISGQSVWSHFSASVALDLYTFSTHVTAVWRCNLQASGQNIDTAFCLQ